MSGQAEIAKAHLKRATSVDPRWAELVARLGTKRMYPLSDETVAALSAS